MVQVAVALDGLRREVDEVAAEEEPVPGLDGEGVAHEGGRVADKSTGHATGDTIRGRDTLAFLFGGGSELTLVCLVRG